MLGEVGNPKTQTQKNAARIRSLYVHGSIYNWFTDVWLTGCVVFAVCAIVATSSPGAVLPSSFRSGAFFVDCILICGGLEFDGKLLVDCSSCKHFEHVRCKEEDVGYLSKTMLQRPSYLSDSPHSLGTSLSEHQSLVTVQILRGLDETEVDWSLVPCP